MKRLLLIGLIVGFAIWVYQVPLGGHLPRLTKLKNSLVMRITSTAFTNEGTIPTQYTCMGANLHPALDISGVPSDAKSLALIMDDPDAPNGTFTHWVVFNIKPTVQSIPEGLEAAPGVTAKNSAGLKQYTGPCPPSGTHRYYFKVYALDNVLPADEILDKEYLMQAMNGHIMDQTEIMGKFSKSN